MTTNVIAIRARPTESNTSRFTTADREQLQALAFKLLDTGEAAEVDWGEGDEGGSYLVVQLPGDDDYDWAVSVSRELDGSYQLRRRGVILKRGPALADVMPASWVP